ncbi:Crp/Fnr family transcriptional regulator [Colwellia sp. MEBiC06753]
MALQFNQKNIIKFKMITIPNMHNWRTILPTEALDELQNCLTFHSFKKGEPIYSSGEAADWGYQMISGTAKLSSYDIEGREVIVSILQKGDCFGDVGLIIGGSRSNYATACSDVELNQLHRNDYLKLCRKYPEVSFEMNKFLSLRIRYMFNQIDDALLLPLYDRLGNMIVKMAIARGEKDDSGRTLLVDVSREMLGQMVGATRQSVGRELKKMLEDNFIEISYGKIYVVDVDRMIEAFTNIVSHEPFIPSYPNN